MKEQKTWYEEVKETFVKNISDSYTLNLAISILEDRKELLDRALILQQGIEELMTLEELKGSENNE